MAKIVRFEDIDAWKLSRDLVTIIYKMTRANEFSRDYGLKEQIQRASVSTMSNIAEGFERNSKKEFIHFLFIAKASAGEMRSQLYIARDLNYVNEDEFNKLKDKCEKVSSCIAKFIKYLKNYQSS